jgi:hypothetical protein
VLRSDSDHLSVTLSVATPLLSTVVSYGLLFMGYSRNPCVVRYAEVHPDWNILLLFFFITRDTGFKRPLSLNGDMVQDANAVLHWCVVIFIEPEYVSYHTAGFEGIFGR